MTTMIDYPQLYIGGTCSEPAGHDTIEVHSPSTKERIGSVPRSKEAAIDAGSVCRDTNLDFRWWRGP